MCVLHLQLSVQTGHSANACEPPLWRVATMLDSKPWAICSRDNTVAFYESVDSLSLVLPFSCTPAPILSVQTARILAVTLPGTEAMWAELGLGFATCSCPHSSLCPLGQPGVTQWGG